MKALFGGALLLQVSILILFLVSFHLFPCSCNWSISAEIDMSLDYFGRSGGILPGLIVLLSGLLI